METARDTASTPTADRHDGIFVLQLIRERKPPSQLLGIEHGDGIATWSLKRGLPSRHGDSRVAERLEDRPLAAGTYEGPEPTGRSGIERVVIEDRGTREVLQWSDDRMQVRLVGARTQGEFVLELGSDGGYEITRSGDAERAWQPLVEPDAPAQATETPLGDDVNWLFEPLWPGRRAWYVHKGEASVVRGSGGLDLSARTGELDGLAAAVGAKQLCLDGVLVVFDPDRRPDPAALEARLSGSAPETPIVYVAFDVVQIDGRDLREYPLWYRRDVLDGLGLDDAHWATSPRWEDTTIEAAQAAVRDLGYDGLVAKRLGSPYGPGGPVDYWRIVRA